MINAKNWRNEDPFRVREIEKYGENPLPSREYILQWLEEQGKLVKFQTIVHDFAMDEEESENLKFRLKAMISSGQIIRNRRGRFGIVSKMNLIKGTVIAHQEGYGFFSPENGGSDGYISPKYMHELMHGDKILARVEAVDYRGREEIAPVEILERKQKRIIGRISTQEGITYLVPENRRLTHLIIIPPDARAHAEDGLVVIGEIETYPTRTKLPTAKIIAVLGEMMAAGMEVEIAMENYKIPHQFPAEVLAQCAKIPDEVQPKDYEGRRDLRHLPFVTIDGISARDFDDAVYAEQRGENYRLYVAIADIGHYVRPKTPLDMEAYKRGTSVYFPDRVVPMLPEKLSNGLCSLNPKVDRLALVCEMTLSPEGKVKRSAFHKAVIHSHARLTYETVENILFCEDQSLRESFSELLRPLENLKMVYEVLRHARHLRGVIDFHSTEPEFIYDSEGKISTISARPWLKSHQLIEECMIIANVCAARFVHRFKVPALYRVHEKPDLNKLETFIQFLAKRNIKWTGNKLNPTPRDYAVVLRKALNRPDYAEIELMALRSMMQAVYSSENRGHFGLALPYYTHFTSPIRRYPDLIVHRAITGILEGKLPEIEEQIGVDIEQAAIHCSQTERNADEATREAMDFLKCEFMSHHIGEIFTGKISSVQPFGLFITLDELYIDGLAHISNLSNDYYEYDKDNSILRGTRSGKIFSLMDCVEVRVAQVDIDDRKIDFALISHRGKKITNRENNDSKPSKNKKRRK